MSSTLDDFCPSCGYRKPPGATACPDCGREFAPPAPEHVAETTPSGEWLEVRRTPPADEPAAAAPPPPPAVPSATRAPAPPPPAAPSSTRAPIPAAPEPPAPPLRARSPLTAALMPAAVPPPEPPPARPEGEERPPVVPRAAPPPATDTAADPPGYATVWPPVSKVREAVPPPEPEPEPERPPEPEPEVAPPPPVAPLAGIPEDMTPPQPPKPPREWPKLDRRAAGVGIAVVLIALAGVALLLVPKGKSPQQAATLGTPTATATPPPERAHGPKLAAQVRDLDALMRFSERGRTAAVSGDFAAAVANRTTLLVRIQRLDAAARDATLKAGLARFAAAVQEALRQNRTCKAACETADLDKVGALKQAALKRLNPLLRRYAHTSYKRAQI